MSLLITDYHRLLPFLPASNNNRLWEQDNLFIIVEEKNLLTEQQKTQNQQLKPTPYQQISRSTDKIRKSGTKNKLSHERKELQQQQIQYEKLQQKLKYMQREEEKLNNQEQMNKKKVQEILGVKRLPTEIQGQNSTFFSNVNRTQLNELLPKTQGDNQFSTQHNNFDHSKLEQLPQSHLRVNSETSFIKSNKVIRKEDLDLNTLEKLQRVQEFKQFVREEQQKKKQEDEKIQNKLRQNYEQKKEKQKLQNTKINHQKIQQNQEIKKHEAKEFEELQKLKKIQEKEILNLNKLLKESEDKVQQRKLLQLNTTREVQKSFLQFPSQQQQQKSTNKDLENHQHFQNQIEQRNFRSLTTNEQFQDQSNLLKDIY